MQRLSTTTFSAPHRRSVAAHSLESGFFRHKIVPSKKHRQKREKQKIRQSIREECRIAGSIEFITLMVNSSS